MNADEWNNLPWTPRGLKFKKAVENIGMFLIVLVVIFISGLSW